MFPLIIPSSYPAFPADINMIKIYFEEPKTSSISINSATIVCSIADQRTNKSVLVDGKSQITSSENYGLLVGFDEKGWYVNIPSSMIEGKWVSGKIYKLQLRYYYKQQFSEWSTVCYLKVTAPSSEISVNILNESQGDIVYLASPVFKGKYTNSDNQETQVRYKFDLCNFNGKVIETTGWKARTDSPHDEVVFNTILENYEHYRVDYFIETKNGYTDNAFYNFYTQLDLLESPNFNIEINKDYIYTEGKIDIKITNNDAPLTTNLVLRRTDSKSNFQKWEDYKYFYILDDYANIYFTDYLIENNVKYKYGVQLVSQDGFRGKLIESESVFVEYEDMFLVGEGKQLKIKFNPKISSLKRQLQETKTETIGSKYPFIRRNGAVNYFTFPIAGLISYKMDEQNLFYNFGSSGLFDKDNKEISFHDAFDTYVHLDNSNISYERIFREATEEFLTNGNYKYFKSPTEGVKIVSIMNVSMTPNDVVGRMIYNFSCTANEVADANLKSALDCQIIDMGQYMSPSNLEGKEYIKLLNFTTTQDENIYERIRAEIEDYSDSSSYAKKLQYLTTLRIEIKNPTVMGNAGYTIKIQQEPNGDFQNIKISKELPVWGVEDVINIYGLKATSAGVEMNIFCKAYCTFETKIKTVLPEDNLKGIQKFYQIYDNFTPTMQLGANINPMDIFERIYLKETSNIKTIQSFSYMRIDATPGIEFKINGELHKTDHNGFWENRDIKITSALMETPGMASITVIYNGVAYA